MKRRILLSLLLVSLLFSSSIAQTSAKEGCEHVSMTRDVVSRPGGNYPHQYVDGGYTRVCEVTLTRDTITYTCTSCGEIVDVIEKISEHHSRKHD